MVERVEVLAAKSDILSSILRTYMEEGENSSRKLSFDLHTNTFCDIHTLK